MTKPPLRDKDVLLRRTALQCFPHFFCGRMKCESASRVEPQPVLWFTFKIVSNSSCSRMFAIGDALLAEAKTSIQKDIGCTAFLEHRYGEYHYLLDKVLNDTKKKKCLSFLRKKPETSLRIVSPF